MKALGLRTDGQGQSRLDALPLPFVLIGPTATSQDGAPAHGERVVLACRSVRGLYWPAERGRVSQDLSGHLLVVVSGQLRVDTAYMRAELDPGDVLSTSNVAPGSYTLTTQDACRLVALQLDGWPTGGTVPPPLQRDAKSELLIHDLVSDQVGIAHFRDLELFPDVGHESTSAAVSTATFTALSPGLFGDWHVEHAPTLVVVLSGGFELTVAGDGASKVFRAGDVCLVQDLHGQGHQTRTHGETRFLSVPVLGNDGWPKSL